MLYGLKLLPRVGVPSFYIVEALSLDVAEAYAGAVLEDREDAVSCDVVPAEAALYHCGGIARLEVIV
jgi:hypothetical protein